MIPGKYIENKTDMALAILIAVGAFGLIVLNVLVKVGVL